VTPKVIRGSSFNLKNSGEKSSPLRLNGDFSDLESSPSLVSKKRKMMLKKPNTKTVTNEELKFIDQIMAID